MDLRTHLGVIWRWRVFFAIGVALAVLLTFFSYYRVSVSDGITHRQGVTWQSSEVLQLTQKGCEYCLAVPSPTTNLGWMTTLTTVYAQLANGDALRNRVLVGKHRGANYLVYPVQDPATPGQTQFLSFVGTAGSPDGAASVARRATTTFLAYLAAQAEAAGISRPKRVVTQVVTRASIDNATIIKDRKKTIPIVVFLSVLVAIFALAYVLENLFPKTREASAGEEQELGRGPADSSRRTPARAAAGD